jgi:hypothetical protein
MTKHLTSADEPTCVSVASMTGEEHIIAGMVAPDGPSVADVLQAVGYFAAGSPLGILLGRGYLRLTQTPATACAHRDRRVLPAAVSPAAAGSYSPAADADTSSRRAVEAPSLSMGASAASTARCPR